MIPSRYSFCIFALSALVSSLSATPVPVTSDVWDISQGATVIDSTPVKDPFTGAWGTYTWEPTGMFGAVSGEPGADGETIFTDDPAYINDYWIEWQTPEPVTLSGFSLITSGDIGYSICGPHRPDYRSVTHVRFVINGQVYDFDMPPQPVDEWNTYQGSFGGLVTAQTFKVYFTAGHDQFGLTGGPRIIELDAIEGHEAPEPGTFALGLAGLGLVLFKLKKARS